MKRSTLLLAALLMAVPIAAQVNDTYVIPVSGNLPGAFGTRWMTQFSVFNPQLDYALKISVVFVPTGGAQGLEALFTVPANSVAFSDNILADLFEVNGSGSLLVATFPEDNPGVPDDVLSRSFLVTSNTYNNSSSGTYGQTIPGIWTGLQDYASDQISAVAHGIRNIRRLGWRTNVGAVNLGRRNATMLVTVYDADGRKILDKAPFGIPPMGHLQQHLPIEVDRGSVEFFVDDASQTAVVFPYTSTIDEFSGDPTYQSPTLLASPKLIYSKGPIAQTALGKKLDIIIARQVKASARSIGAVILVKTDSGYRITR
jgi:hypothetical protein